MKRLAWLVSLLMLCLVGTPLHAVERELETVPYVDLNRYMGQWYEIAHMPFWSQRNCFASTAHYTLNDDGTVTVINACRKGQADGPLKEVRGKAWVVDAESQSKLKVQFFWPFSGNYWVLKLGEQYEYAVVSEPNRKYLWILSRTPTIDPDLYQEILQDMDEWGFDTTKLIRTEHPY